MPISVASRRRLRGIAAPLRAIVSLALAQQGRRAGEVAVVLTDDATLRDLNLRYRAIDRATDVLSFGYDEPATGAPTPAARGGARAVEGRPPRVTGDIVISLDRMREQARRFRVTPGCELARLLVHGALHLSGLDHQTGGQRAHMRRHESAALREGARAIAALDRALDSEALAAPGRRTRGPDRRRARTAGARS